MKKKIELKQDEISNFKFIMQGDIGLVDWFVAHSEGPMMTEILERNNVASQAEELLLLVAILTGDYEVIEEVNPGDIMIRTRDRISHTGKAWNSGDMFEVRSVHPHGVIDNGGTFHTSKSVRRATDIEKQFFRIGRNRVEFVEGDYVRLTNGCTLMVRRDCLSVFDALRELNKDRIVGFYPRETRVEIR